MCRPWIIFYSMCRVCNHVGMYLSAYRNNIFIKHTHTTQHNTCIYSILFQYITFVDICKPDKTLTQLIRIFSLGFDLSKLDFHFISKLLVSTFMYLKMSEWSSRQFIDQWTAYSTNFNMESVVTLEERKNRSRTWREFYFLCSLPLFSSSGYITSRVLYSWVHRTMLQSAMLSKMLLLYNYTFSKLSLYPFFGPLRDREPTTS